MSANKVGEIFTAAGAAFSRLGELTMQLQASIEESPSSGGKWTDKEITMLQDAVKTFSENLTTVSGVIKNRTISQIKTQLKKKSYEEAGLSSLHTQTVTGQTTSVKVSPTKRSAASARLSSEQAAKKHKSSEVTLSALNAPEGDVDIEGLGDQSSVKKLEFDSDVPIVL